MAEGRRRTIGRFEIVCRLGRGGMGTVYQAVDPRLDRMVALKVIREDGAGDPAFMRGFEREARAAARLNSPHIVTLHEFGEADGEPFLVMELIQGRSLAELIAAREPFPTTRWLSIVEDVCAGLGHAHAAGVVHRDIKPANVLVTADGRAKVVDFGIARLGDASSTAQPRGTVPYMSPEQVKGRPVDARSDLFSVGAVLYEALTFQRAFPGELGEVLMKIIGEEPVPLLTLRPDLPAAMDAVVRCALAKNPEDRYQSATAMASAIAAVREQLAAAAGAETAPSPEAAAATTAIVDDDDADLVETERPVTPPARAVEPTPAATPSLVVAAPRPLDRPGPRRIRPLWLAGALVVGLLMVAGWLWRNRTVADGATSTPPAPLQTAAPTPVAAAPTPARTSSAPSKPEPSRPYPMGLPGAPDDVAVSDDGRYIALKAADTVFSVDRQSGELVQIAPGDDVSMSGDGQFVAFARHIDDEDDDDDGGYGPDVFVWSRATRAIEQISVTPAGKPSVPEHYGSYVPIISRDGRWVEFISEAADLTPGDTNRSRDVFLRDRRNGVTTRRNVTAQGAQAWNHSNEHAMSRNGRYSVFTSWSENLFGGKLENLVFQDGATRVPRLVTRPGVMPSAGIGAFAVADNGTVVFTALRPGTKYDDVLAIDTGGAARLITRPDGLLVDAERIKVDITTDGRRVFFVSDQPLVADDTNGKSDVYAVDVKTGEIERLSVGPDGRQLDGYCSLKAVSGTGRLVTFSSGDTILSQQGDSKSVLLVRDTVARTTSLLLRKLDASATE